MAVSGQLNAQAALLPG